MSAAPSQELDISEVEPDPEALRYEGHHDNGGGEE